MSGYRDFFDEQARKESRLRKLILTYQSECQSRGQGRKRDRMDWGRYQDTLLMERRVRTGTASHYMTYQAWETHYLAEGYSAEEAVAEWNRTSNMADKQGPCGSLQRLMEVCRYQKREDVIGNKQESIACTKDIQSMKHGILEPIQQQDQDFKDVVSGMAVKCLGPPTLYRSPASSALASDSGACQPALGGSGVSLPALTGRGSSQPALSTASVDANCRGSLHPGSATETEPPKKKMKDVARFRLGLHEKARASVTQLEVTSKDVIRKAMEELATLVMLGNKDSFTPYCDVLETRFHGLEALIHPEGESKVKEFCELHKDKLKDTPITTWETVTCLPAMATQGLKSILGASTAEDAQCQYNKLTADLTVIASMRSAVETSVRVLQSAARQEAKRQERVALRQKQEAEKRRNAEALNALGAAKRACKRGGGPPDKAVSIFDWPQAAFSAIRKVDYQEFGNTSMLSPLEPVLVTGYAELSAVMDADAQVKAAFANFKHQASHTTLFKTQGRVASQLPLALQGSIAKALVRPFLEHASFGQHVREVPDAHPSLALHHRIFMHMSSPMTQTCATEEQGVGQLRYICEGARSVKACCLESLMHVLRVKIGLQVPPELCLAELAALVKQNLHNPKLQEADWHCVEQPVNSVLYLPTGWLLFESALNCQTVLGLRRAMLVPSAASWGIYEQLMRASRPAKAALTVLDATSKLLQVLPRSHSQMYFQEGDHWMLKLKSPDDDSEYIEYVSVVTAVSSMKDQATFTRLRGPAYSEELAWPADRERLLRLILPGSE